MDGEQRDYAIAFAKGVITGQNSGKNSRKLLTNQKLCKYLNISNMTDRQLPSNILSVFKEYNVYVRKLRGKDMWGVWWQEEGEIAHGRGKSK